MNEVLKKDSVPFKSLRYVEVRWLDAAVGDSWIDIKGDTDVDVALCISRGWVVREDEKQIVLAGSVSLDKDGRVDGANNTIAVPFPMIQSVVDFPIKRKRVAKKQPPAQEVPAASKEVSK